MSFEGDGLPNPAADPVSPLLAFIMNSTVRMGGAMIGKAIEKIQEAPGKLAEAASSVTAKVSAHVDNFSHKPSETPETIKAVKERQLAQGIESPGLPEHAKASALKVERAEAIKPDVQEVSLAQAMSMQVVGVAQRQEQAIGIA